MAVIFFSIGTYASDDCLNWFNKSGINPGTPECELKCATLVAEMGTFTCPNRCDEFCKPKAKCKHDMFWLKKIKSERPNKWPISSEKTVPWSEEYKEKLLAALEQLPDEFKLETLVGFYRMQKSAQIINPGTEIDSAIVLYDRAFNGPFSLARVVAHELAHQWYESSSAKIKIDYREQLGWIKSDTSEAGFKPDSDRKFVDSDADSSPDEDFAHNMEAYLFDAERLRHMIPKAFEWIQNHLSKNFKLKESCKDEKKK